MTPSRRILFLLPQAFADLRGGARSNLLILRHLEPRPVVLMTPNREFERELAAAGIETHVVQAELVRGGGPSVTASLRALAGRSPLVAAGWRLMSEQAPGLLHSDWEWGYLGHAIARPFRTPVVLYMRGHNRQGYGRKALIKALLAARVVTVSRAVADELVRSAPPSWRPSLAAKVVTVHNAVDPAPPVSRFRAEPPHAVVIVGVLEPNKGQKKFVEQALPAILAALPHTRLILAGDPGLHPGYADEVRRAAERIGAGDRVVLAGHLSPERIHQDVDLVCIPSISEGISRAALEAQAAGVPVIALDIPGMEEAVGPASGLRVPGLREMGESAAALLADTATRERMAAAGPEFVRRNFDPVTNARKLGRVHADVLRDRWGAAPGAQEGVR